MPSLDRLFVVGIRARGSQLPASAVRGIVARTREGTKWAGVQKPRVRGRRILVADFGWVDGVDGRDSLLVAVGEGGVIVIPPLIRLDCWSSRWRCCWLCRVSRARWELFISCGSAAQALQLICFD